MSYIYRYVYPVYTQTHLRRPRRRVAVGVDVGGEPRGRRGAAFHVGDDHGHVVVVLALVPPEGVAERVAALARAKGETHLHNIAPESGLRLRSMMMMMLSQLGWVGLATVTNIHQRECLFRLSVQIFRATHRIF